MPYTPDMGEGTKRMSVEEVRADIGGRIDAAWFKGENTLLTKYGQDRAALVPLSVLKRAALADAYEAKYGPLDEAE